MFQEPQVHPVARVSRGWLVGGGGLGFMVSVSATPFCKSGHVLGVYQSVDRCKTVLFLIE